VYGKLHHIGIGVKNLNKTIERYQNLLGFQLTQKLDWDKDGLNAALFPVGDMELEFIEAPNAKGEIPLSLAEAIRAKDGIVHHLCFTVEDIPKTIKTLKEKGIKVIIENPQAAESDQVVWLEEKDAGGGFMIELVKEGYEIK
jgi:methylmalonyl-CoA/ethylmalonyl-CoA epimerase